MTLIMNLFSQKNVYTIFCIHALYKEIEQNMAKKLTKSIQDEGQTLLQNKCSKAEYKLY